MVFGHDRRPRVKNQEINALEHFLGTPDVVSKVSFFLRHVYHYLIITEFHANYRLYQVIMKLVTNYSVLCLILIVFNPEG